MGMRHGPGEAGGVERDLGREAEAGRLHVGEGRHGRALERLPDLGDPPPELPQPEDARLVRRVGLADRLADDHRRIQEHGALGAAPHLTDRHVFDREAEEAGEADRLDVGHHGLQRPPDDLGTDVDAEGGLHRRPPGGRGTAGGQREFGHQLALMGGLDRELQREIDGEFGVLAEPVVGRQRRGLRHGRGPGGAEGRVPPLQKQRVAPDEPDREEVDQPVVLRSVERGRPAEVADVGRPAEDVEEGADEIILHRPRRDAERGDDRLDRGDGFVGERRDGRAEVPNAEDLGIAVVPHRQPPGRIGREGAPGQRPGGLTRVEISGAPLGDLVDHESGARGPPVAVGEPVEHLGDGRDHGPGLHEPERLAGGGGLEALDGLRNARHLRRAGERSEEVVVRDPAGRDGLAIPGPRHQHVGADDALQRGGGGREALTGEAEEGVHGHEGLERPERRDAAAGGLDGPVEGGAGKAGGGVEGHGGGLGESGHRITGSWRGRTSAASARTTATVGRPSGWPAC